jgi:hypothetical protein
MAKQNKTGMAQRAVKTTDPLTLTPGQGGLSMEDFNIPYRRAAWHLVMGQWLFFATRDNRAGYRNQLDPDGLIYQTSPRLPNELVPQNSERPCCVHVFYRLKPAQGFTYLGVSKKIQGYDPQRNKLVLMVPAKAKSLIE